MSATPVLKADTRHIVLQQSFEEKLIYYDLLWPEHIRVL